MIRFHSRFTQTPTLVFDPEDQYARLLGFSGANPRPQGWIEVDLVQRIVANVPVDYPWPIGLQMIRNSSGYLLFFDRIRTTQPRSSGPPVAAQPPATSVATQMKLDPGRYVVRVRSEYYQPLEVAVAVPMSRPIQPIRLDLAPAAGYPFPSGTQPSGLPEPTLLRGAIQNADGSALEGGKVRADFATNSLRCQLDDGGQWVIPLPDPVPPRGSRPSGRPTSIDVTFTFLDKQDAVLHQQTRPVDYGKSFRFPRTALVGRVLSAAGAPLGGCTLAIASQPGQARSASDGRWIYYFLPGRIAAPSVVSLVVTTPDGQVQSVDVTAQAERDTPVANIVF